MHLHLTTDQKIMFGNLASGLENRLSVTIVFANERMWKKLDTIFIPLREAKKDDTCPLLGISCTITHLSSKINKNEQELITDCFSYTVELPYKVHRGYKYFAYYRQCVKTYMLLICDFLLLTCQTSP